VSVPTFAIVGHPNKGKSSLVATLSRDASVRIGPEPGTTVHAREFPMRAGGKVLYTLVDTPGFQRARAALDWMKRHDTTAASRAEVVERFVREHEHDERFRNECELLRPVVAGAGLIYVVDGAAPYGPEYEAEMEILRWTGQPSLAVINPIGEPLFVEPWRRALEQFFRVVRVLDVLKAPFDQQLELLRAFGQLRESWRQPLEVAVVALMEHRDAQRGDAARVIAEMMADALTHQESRDIGADEDPSRHVPSLETNYARRLRAIEDRARRDVEAVYGFDELDREEVDMKLLETDLLSRESWLVFGLKKRDLVVVSATGGAIAGGVVDSALLGASFLAGSVIGGVIGGAVGYFSSGKLADVKLLRQPMGGVRLRYGPSRNVQFSFVLLNRALLHHSVVAGRTHAQRGVLTVRGDSAGTAETANFVGDNTREVARHLERLRRSEPGTDSRVAALDALTGVILDIMDRQEKEGDAARWRDPRGSEAGRKKENEPGGSV
jgi:hypothetical protein